VAGWAEAKSAKAAPRQANFHEAVIGVSPMVGENDVIGFAADASRIATVNAPSLVRGRGEPHSILAE
jgi:hypothetical protein